MSDALSRQTQTRRLLLSLLKQEGAATIADLADRTALTSEGIRRQLLALERDGLVERHVPPGAGTGRPPARYGLSSAGEELFPKDYSQLAVALLDAVAAELGPEAAQRVLARITRERMRALTPRLEGLSNRERIRALADIYRDDDPWTEVEATAEGFRLVEWNCPYLEVAMKRPLLCSTTVCTLRNLLGVQVVREKRFQNGDGCCSFLIHIGRPVEPGLPVFTPEPVADEDAREG